MRTLSNKVNEALIYSEITDKLKKFFGDKIKIEGKDKFFIGDLLVTYKISDIDKNKLDIIWSKEGDVKSITYNKKTDDVISDDNNFNLSKQDQKYIIYLSGYIIYSFNKNSKIGDDALMDIIEK